MKRITLLALLLLSLITGSMYAQNVLVSGATVGNGLYPDLNSAFTAINAGSQTGTNIVVSIIGNTTEASSALLNAGTWNSISIIAAGGGARTISGNIAGPLVDFNGADRIGVDGFNTGGNSLTFDNTNITTASTILFRNDAHLIAVQNATIRGANSSAVSGTISFSTGSATGNDSITFNACTIDASGANFPTNSIYSAGTAVAGQENSLIAINNCNIANFYNSALVSCGILAAAGNTDWTIQNNRFYQSATRNYTTANIHRAIQINSGNNYTISTNVIGYATSAATGTYAMTSTVATRFIAIDLAVGTSVATNVNGNTFTAYSLTTSSGAATANGIVCGVNITSGNVNVGNAVGNTIGGSTGVNLVSAVPTTANGMVVGVNSSSTGTIVISNNIIGGLSSSGSTAAVSGNITGVNVAGIAASMTISGNTIGNTTADNMRGGTLGLTTGASGVSGINLPSTPTVSVITNNTIQNLSSFGTSTGTGAYVRGIWTAAATGSLAGYTISTNSIHDLKTNSALTTITSGQAGACGINISIGSNDIVNNNTIFNISNINTGAITCYVVGITAGNATSTTLRNNVIYGITNASTGTTLTAPPVAAGIVIRSGTTAIDIYNNMISLGNGQTTNTCFLGIQANHGSTPDPVNRIYNNTINIEGTVAAGALPSFGFARTDFSATARTPTVDFRNNIVTNTRTGGTGAHYAIANNFGAVTSTATGWPATASNYNVLNATASTVGYWSSASQTMAGWRTVSGGDALSYSGITVTYVNSVTNLHLNMGVTPTFIESSGTTIATVTNDIDAQNRPGPTGSVNGGAFAYDIGADEFDGVPLDGLAPTITYTAFTFTCLTSDRTLTATIADLSGVPTTGPLQPRIYFRKNANAWVSAQGTLASGNATNGTWNFIISSAAMGGITAGDIISYYVIAQDVATPTSNIGSNPAAGLVASDVNTVGTPPTTPNTYTIGGTLTGTYTVGASGNFPTLTAAVNTYNVSCLSGPVVFSLIDATYPSETFPITINANPNASAVNTLTIKPATGVTATITGSTATAIIILNGADFITINGNNGTTANTVCPRVTASRDLTIENTNTSTASAVVSIQTSATNDAAVNNALINCNISGNASLTTGVAINISGPTIGSGTGANQNNNNQVINNAVRRAQVGIFAAGSGQTTRNLNNSYNLNDLNFTGIDALGRVGIMVLYEDAPSILSNNVGNITNTGSVDVMGITVGSNTAGNTVTTGADVINATISGNTISDLVQTNTFSSVGINIGPAASGTTNVSNNIINRVFCNGTSPDFACGIYYAGGAGTLNIYHNTVVVTGSTLTGATQPNMAVGINGTTPTVDISNNVLVCAGSNGFNGNTGIGLAYTGTTGNYANLTSNYNDIFVAGTTSSVGRTGGLSAGIQRVTLPDWQTETGRDLNSVSVAPVTVSATDLHLVAGSNPGLEDAAPPIVSVSSDIDCQVRNTCAVDMGADEFGTPREADVTGNSVVITDGDNSPVNTDFTDFDSTSVCSGTVVRNFIIQNNGTSALTISSVNITGANAADFTITTSPASPIAAAGTSTLTITFDPSAAGMRTATVTINSNDCDEAVYDFAIQGIGTQITIAATMQTDVTCNGGANGDATVVALGGMPSINYSWSSGGTNATELNLTAGTYTCTVTDANGCTATQSFTITEPSAITSSVSQTNPLCNGGTGDATVSSSGGTGTHTYSWSSGGTSATETGLNAGTFTVTITDANGCTSLDSVTIVEPTAMTASFTQNDPLCNGGTGDATISASGGTGTLTYSWSSGGTSTTETGLNAGTFTVTITDANGCTSMDSVTIVEPTLITASFTQNSPLCNGGTGDATVISSGGTGTHTYSWSSGGTSATETGLSGGTYTITITDANGCSVMDSVTIVEPAAISVTLVSSTSPTTCGGNDGSIDITTSGGTPGYTFSWSNSASTEDLSGIPAGSYILNITDANGCTGTNTLVLNDPNPPVVTLAVAQDSACTLDATFALTGGSPSGGTYSGPGISAGVFNPASANAGYNLVTYTYTDPNTNCSAFMTDSIWVDPCSGITEMNNANNSGIYPNPSYGVFNLELGSNAQVIVYNTLGEIILNQYMNAGRHEISLEGKASGIYSVHIMNGNQRQVIRLVKE